MTLREYLSYLRDTRTEVAILAAAVLMVLVLTEPLVMSALEWLWPSLHANLSALDADLRRVVLGAPPAMVLLVGGLWRDFRRIRRDRI